MPGPNAMPFDLRPGDDVMVKWGSTQWWPAKLLEVRDDGTAKIGYVGWDEQEVVPLRRVRPIDFEDEQEEDDGPHGQGEVKRKLRRLLLDGQLIPAPHDVTAHLEPDWSVSGRLVEVTVGFLVMERRPDGKRVLINRARVAYLEVHESARPGTDLPAQSTAIEEAPEGRSPEQPRPLEI